MELPLVSMITYCYNGERFVSKYFEAILSQTYRNIELIFINNGSVDRTGEIAELYKKKLEAKGVQVQLIHYEKNQNTCALKQKSFSLMHGEYFFGCDSDDIIHRDYIEKMAGYLIEHPDKGIVFCELNDVLEDTGETIGVSKRVPRYGDKEAFLDMLYARNSIYTAISYMMSRRHYLAINDDFNFYVSKYGENYQLQLPFLYHNLQGYIEEPLGDYTIRRDSYTGQLKADYAKQVAAYLGQEETILATLKMMNIGNELEKYQSIVQKRLKRDRFYASLRLNNKQLRRECYESLCSTGGAGLKERVVYYCRPLYLRLKK